MGHCYGGFTVKPISGHYDQGAGVRLSMTYNLIELIEAGFFIVVYPLLAGSFDIQMEVSDH
jgi:hypothetical protein